jgi:hypothetical protein
MLITWARTRHCSGDGDGLGPPGCVDAGGVGWPDAAGAGPELPDPDVRDPEPAAEPPDDVVPAPESGTPVPDSPLGWPVPPTSAASTGADGTVPEAVADGDGVAPARAPTICVGVLEETCRAGAREAAEEGGDAAAAGGEPAP